MSLHLLPNRLSDDQDLTLVLPKEVLEVVKSLQHLIVENEKEARKYIFQLLPREEALKLKIYLLNEHTSEKELDLLTKRVLKNKEEWGVLSDAGLPSISDPAYRIVTKLRKHAYPIKVYAGPSAPIYALLLSGFAGDAFSYHGYLPRKEEELTGKLQELEKKSKKDSGVQIWIDAPYRTQKMVDICLKSLQPTTLFSVSINLTSSKEKVIVDKVASWKKIRFEKEPAVFLLKA